jgi:hypothetical protein
VFAWAPPAHMSDIASAAMAVNPLGDVRIALFASIGPATLWIAAQGHANRCRRVSRSPPPQDRPRTRSSAFASHPRGRWFETSRAHPQPLRPDLGTRPSPRGQAVPAHVARKARSECRPPKGSDTPSGLRGKVPYRLSAHVVAHDQIVQAADRDQVEVDRRTASKHVALPGRLPVELRQQVDHQVSVHGPHPAVQSRDAGQAGFNAQPAVDRDRQLIL